MGEFDELLAIDGVLMVGRFGPDWRLVEHQTKGLFFEVPAAIAAMGTFCAAIQMMFQALATAMGGLTPASWSPVHGWAASGGDHTIVLHGDRFVLAETNKVGGFDQVRRLLSHHDTDKG